MFQYPIVGNPWQPSAALGVPNQAVSGGLCPTSQDPLDSVRELLSGFKDSMRAEISSLNSRLSVLESSTKVRVEPVPPSPESQEDEVGGRRMKFLWHLVVRRGSSSMKRNLTLFRCYNFSSDSR